MEDKVCRCGTDFYYFWEVRKWVVCFKDIVLPTKCFIGSLYVFGKFVSGVIDSPYTQQDGEVCWVYNC